MKKKFIGIRQAKGKACGVSESKETIGEGAGISALIWLAIGEPGLHVNGWKARRNKPLPMAAFVSSQARPTINL